MKKILVIEDTLEVRENLCEILELDGFESIAAANGKEGVQLAISEQPDLIICDIMMPELDGFGVLSILSKNKNTTHIPFIFLTAKSDVRDLRKGMGLGADDYITKPFEDADLFEAIEVRLKKSEAVSRSTPRNDIELISFFSNSNGDDNSDNFPSERELRHYKKKEYVYSINNRPHWLFYLVSGSVKCFQSNEFGKKLITHIYKKGDFFGYYPLITQSPYIDNVMAIEDTSLRLIPKNDFSHLLLNNRNFADQFIKMTSSESQATEQHLLELAYSSVRRKVAMALLSFTNKNDVDKIINISRDDLASRAGTAKETLIRTLSEFKSEGIIAIQNGAVIVLQEEKLNEIPQG